jgi:YegS/Rv2252/BmrU family lipid kinase
MTEKSEQEQKRVLLIYNPVAGQDDDGAARQKIEERMKEKNWKLDVYETTGEEVLADIVRERSEQDVDLVIVAGGDGTVAGVASGLVKTKIPLAIVAGGSGNIVAQELRIPTDVDEALDLVTGEHEYRDIDALCLGSSYYFLTVSIGMSTRVMRDTKREQKRRFGFFAYVYNGLSSLSGIKLRHFRLDVDGQKLSGWASEILVVNAGLMGLKAVREGLGVKPDDGKMEVCIVRSRTLVDLMGVLWNVLVVGEQNHPELKCLDVKEYVRIETSEPTIVEGDGEIIGKTPLQLNLVAHAIRVVVPPESMDEE